MKSKAKPKAEKYNVPAIYLGERVGLFGQIQHVFRTKAGRELRYGGSLKGVWYGDIYLTSAAGGIRVRPDRAPMDRNHGLKPTAKERADFELHKELAKHERLNRRKAMQLKKPHGDIVKAIELLRPFMRGADAITISRFTGYLVNQITKGRRK